ncbi:chemotaxis protein methyltransferase CheR [Rhizomicrobium palustre]|uniref:Chemotaxis protein methyltransferase n=1 Tax=Rhizomicrobium palustre TaxID=189966 RepID=A0A846N1R1_9PROT|nr:CheR family methyltransferase [Rhizomicrobium palustre]NIK89087.1 chemotaxis protein methyltransferase CheR [Rhizomicrobium palustre]
MLPHFEGDGEPITPRNFERLTGFIKSYCGITITEAKRSMLEGRVRRRIRALNMENMNAYCDLLFAEASEAEITELIDAVTTNKTDFFREPAHFDYLTQKILPEILSEGQRHIRVWSAACSIGAEPYTIAMLLDDFCRKHHGLSYSVLATDICVQSLNRALMGRFSENMMDPVPPHMLHQYVMRSSDPSIREVRISPKLRAHVSFARLNLMDEHYPVPKDFDVIFLRNVLIYFDKPTQVKVPVKLGAHLREGGYLILGHSESISRNGLGLQPVANTVFQRR